MKIIEEALEYKNDETVEGKIHFLTGVVISNDKGTSGTLHPDFVSALEGLSALVDGSFDSSWAERINEIAEKHTDMNPEVEKTEELIDPDQSFEEGFDFTEVEEVLEIGGVLNDLIDWDPHSGRTIIE